MKITTDIIMSITMAVGTAAFIFFIVGPTIFPNTEQIIFVTSWIIFSLATIIYIIKINSKRGSNHEKRK
jgi:hypothetical protein